MKNKSLLSLITILSLIMCFILSAFITADAADCVITNGTATILNASDNASLIVAAYDENNALLGCKIYEGEGTITGNYTEDLGESIDKAFSIKTFLWDMNTITPLTENNNDVLVIYFSRTGTTEALAKNIQAKTGGDLIEILPVEPYSDVYNECTARAQEEINSDARPEILTRITDIDQYDTILVGYPIWGNTVPPVVRTFLDSYDLSGKTIMPFCTHGGSGISGSMTKMRELCPNSTVTVGLDSSTEVSINTWLEETGFNSRLTPTPIPEPTHDTKILVAYFSATNNTEGIAKYIVDAIDTDEYEIVPEVPYTSDDLNYNTDCRANREQNDASARPAISGSVENMEDYDIIFLGYPIWWGQAPKIIYTFLESYDLSGKTIVPFCTSASSGIGSSATNLRNLSPNSTWLSGTRFSASASRSSVVSWINGLGLNITAE